MLHAVENSKTTRARQYAQPAKRDEHDELHRKYNLQAEDEITSIVIGPMEFFNPEVSLNFWLDLIGESNSGIKSENRTELVEFKLWAKRSFIEPDGLIVYKNGGQKYIFLLEVKWNAELSEKQLEKQWDSFLNKRERQNATHIFLGKDVKDAIQVRNDRQKRDHKITVLSWQKFRNFLNKLPECRYPREFVRWAKLAETFLEKCGVIDFGGFGQILNSYKELPPGFSCSSRGIFWHQFSGFSGYYINSDLAHQDSIFFNQGENNEWE